MAIICKARENRANYINAANKQEDTFLNNDAVYYGSVCVLISAYKPNLEYFGKQLDSIDCQTYPIYLLVRNDCPDSESLETFISEHIKNKIYIYTWVYQSWLCQIIRSPSRQD